jgi:hypothetical protein
MTLILVTAGLAAAVWGSGRLAQAPSRPSSSWEAGAGPDPGLTTPAGPRATPPAAADAPVTVVAAGTGTFTNVQSAGPVLGTAGPLRRFRVAVENGINDDPNAFRGDRRPGTG